MISLCLYAICVFTIIGVIIYIASKSSFMQPLFSSPNSALRVSYDPNLYGTDNMINLASM